jgi:hypothetical protein
MCTKDVSTKIYECGDRVIDDVKFESCNDMTASGHKVKVNELGSNRVKGECGKANCRNP